MLSGGSSGWPDEGWMLLERVDCAPPAGPTSSSPILIAGGEVEGRSVLKDDILGMQ